MKTNSLGFIGGGRITKIFLQAFDNRKARLGPVVVFDTNAEVLSALKRDFPEIQVAENLQQAAQQAVVFIALHPTAIMETVSKIADIVSDDAVVASLAPKITIDKFASKLKTQNILRLIPNATSYINEGYNPVAFAEGFDPDYKDQLLDLLKILGNTFEVPEPKLEAYAIVSAMLPTYFWFQWEELIDIGKQMGLSEEESSQSVHDTMKAALSLYFNAGLTPDKTNDLIPVKPIGECQPQIREIYRTRLMGLFERIKP
jgi:pyrroline-5-carboxylate reductase